MPPPHTRTRRPQTVGHRRHPLALAVLCLLLLRALLVPPGTMPAVAGGISGSGDGGGFLLTVCTGAGPQALLFDRDQGRWVPHGTGEDGDSRDGPAVNASSCPFATPVALPPPVPPLSPVPVAFGTTVLPVPGSTPVRTRLAGAGFTARGPPAHG